jgi:thioredoxin-like negative regulator of GroEL
VPERLFREDLSASGLISALKNHLLRGMSVRELTDQNYKELFKEKAINIVDVYASWCGNCRLFAPAFEEVAGTHPEYNFFKVDGEANEEFASQIAIDNLPFIAVFHNGEYLGGKSTSKKESLLGMIETLKAKL